MRFFSSILLLLLTVSATAQSITGPSVKLLNSPYDELDPVLSPDGKTLFVTIANHPSNIGGKKDPGDIWIAVLSADNQWSAPVHGGTLLNDRGYNGVAGLARNADRLYLLSHYDASGTARTQGIAVSVSAGGGWSKPENIVIPYFQNKAGTLSGYILPDQSAFIFSAETYGTRGVEDLYVSVKGADGKWTEPKNLGSRINTQFQELSPSLSSDGMTLYFSSNGRKGLGSFDVYTSTRLDDTWTNWSEPVNMGPSINTEGRDLFYRIYPDRGMASFTTTKNSDGYGDVRIFQQQEATPSDTLTPMASIETAPQQPTTELAPDRIRIYGKVTNAKSGESIRAQMSFSSPSLQQEATASNGEGYVVNITSPDEYAVTIQAPGFVSALEKLDIHTFEMRELEMNFKLQPVELGVTVNLKNVLFEQGKAQLLNQSYPELDLVVSFLQANPKVKIELSGHTDNRGIPTQNVKLSQARVDKVKTYLTGKGIDRKRITGKGYGGSKPIASNDTEETRQLNRRVEFTIKKF